MSNRTCEIDGCTNKSKARGYCPKHYQSWRRSNFGTCSIDGCENTEHARSLCKSHYLFWREENAPRCEVDKCESPIEAKRYCSKHYHRWKKHGSTEDPYKKSVEEVFLENISQDGACVIWTGSITPHGYGDLRVNRNFRLRAHRYAWERINGPIPEDRVIDHKCWNRACVNPDHLRLATSSQNAAYLSAGVKDTNSGHRNVYKMGNKWWVKVQKSSENHYFGVYEDLEEAIEVAKQAREELFGEFAGKATWDE